MNYIHPTEHNPYTLPVVRPRKWRARLRMCAYTLFLISGVAVLTVGALGPDKFTEYLSRVELPR